MLNVKQKEKLEYATFAIPFFFELLIFQYHSNFPPIFLVSSIYGTIYYIPYSLSLSLSLYL